MSSNCMPKVKQSIKTSNIIFHDVLGSGRAHCMYICNWLVVLKYREIIIKKKKQFHVQISRLFNSMSKMVSSWAGFTTTLGLQEERKRGSSYSCKRRSSRFAAGRFRWQNAMKPPCMPQYIQASHTCSRDTYRIRPSFRAASVLRIPSNWRKVRSFL